VSTDRAAVTGTATWQDPGWRGAALEWASERLAEQGLSLDGEPEQPHIRAWSTAFRLPVPGGAVWLKSVGPGSDQEPVLVAALGEWVPEHVLVPLAVHRERRLMLLPDGGATLREAGGASSVETWEAMLRDYAHLQLDLVPHAEEMVALGVPDLGPERLPELAAELLADDPSLMLDRPDGLTSERRERLVAGLGHYREQCRRLADSGIPASLQHDDLHDANVFVADGRHRFFDWGDASVAHPFLSLLVPLRAAARSLDVRNGDALLLRLRDAYLEPWTGHGSARTLREQCDLALAVGPLPRAMTWRRILRGVHPAERVEWQDAVPGWTAEYLEPGMLAAPAAAPAGRPGD
jgi:hypothetical protein